MSAALDRMLGADTVAGRRAVAYDLVPEYVGALDPRGTLNFGDVVVWDMPTQIASGWSDEEIMDTLGRWAYLGHRPTLREMNAARALLAVLRGTRKAPQIEPLSTPEEALAAYRRTGSERRAASELGISKTQLRRYLGKDD